MGHVLVVDDQPYICRMIGNMLTRLGYAVSTANNFSDADALLARQAFSVVISDIFFGDNQGDGISLLERSQELQPDTPVILITGVPSVDTASLAVKRNAFEYLPKPVSVHQLAESVAAAAAYKTRRAEKKKNEVVNQQYRKDLEELVQIRTANLVRTNQRYQLLFENSKDAIYMAARDGAILGINNAALELFGHSREELIQLNSRALYVDPDQCRRFQEVIEEEGFVKDFEARMQKRDGGRIDCLLTAHTLVEPDGTIVGVQGIIRDITEQKRAERKIRVQNEFLVNVIESLAHPFMVIDAEDYTIKIANSAAKRKRFEEGMACHELNHGYEQPCSPDEQRCVVREVVASRRPVTLEHFHLDPRGREIEHEVHAFPLFDNDGNVVQVIQYCIDITEKKRLESIAEAANLMDNLGYIFSGIRHEIGNPINSVKMALSVLSMNLNHYPRETIAEFVDRGQAEIARVEYLLKALKSFSMFESPQVEPTGMADFMKHFMALVENDFIGKGVTIRLEPIGEDVAALIDHRAFHQVMLNLLTNAADALQDSEHPRITIDVRRTATELVRVQVSDNGRGMTREERCNLFRPFFTSKPHGTGLGLVIIKKMLAKMNASIRIDSNSGWGTTVEMFLPAARGEYEHDQKEVVDPR